MTITREDVKIKGAKEGVMDKSSVEIERKYVIMKPDFDSLCERYDVSVSEIWQTYLSSEPGITRRVRKRVYKDKIVYTLTEKKRIDKVSSYEDEREISGSDYENLLGQIMTGTRTLRKTRRVVRIDGVSFEIDEYPEWCRTCIMETELKSKDELVTMPDFVKIIAEVTGVKRYTNASMSREFSEELI